MFTVVVGVIFITLFPKQVANPVSLTGIRYFNKRETYILAKRVLLDDPSKIHAKAHVSWVELKRAVGHIPSLEGILLSLTMNSVDKLAFDPSYPAHHRRACSILDDDVVCTNLGGLIRLR
jgi:hypothetical protein